MRRAQEHNKHRKESIFSRALCCSSNTTFSISSSSSSGESSEGYLTFSDQHGSLSSLTHYMIQDKLDRMIKERQEATHQEKIRQRRRRRTRARSEGSNTKFIVMMAMEKCSYDPREDFKDSMVEMIVANQINDTDELRGLLEHYLMMNPREYWAVILDIFYKVCADLFMCS